MMSLVRSPLPYFTNKMVGNIRWVEVLRCLVVGDPRNIDEKLFQNQSTCLEVVVLRFAYFFLPLATFMFSREKNDFEQFY